MNLQFTELIRNRSSARVFVIAVLIVILVPAFVFASFLAVSSARLERAQLEQNAQNKSREVAAAIDREVIAIENVLVTLASSSHLQAGDLEAFYRKAVNASRAVGVVIVLRDTQRDQQAVNTAFSFGTQLAQGTRPPRSEADEQVLRSGKPIVTNVYFGRLLNEYFVSAMVPIFVGNDLRYFLSAGVSLKRFADLVGSLSLSAEQVVNVIDRNGVFITRSLDHGAYAGKRISYLFPPDAQSVVRGTGRNGIPSHWFIRQSDLLGWRIATGVPNSVLEAPMKRAVGTLIAAGGLLFCIALGFGHIWGGRLAQSAGAFGIDRKPTREEFEVLFDSAPHGVMVADDHGRILLVNARLAAEFGYLRDELIGQQVEILLPERLRGGHAMLRQVFARDPQARVMAAGRELYARRKDGTEFPVEIGLSPIKPRGDRLVMVTVMDISARKLASQRLLATTTERDELRRRFVRAQEQERLRLAHELHDQTGQSLTAVMLEIKDIEKSAEDAHRQRFRLLRLDLEQIGQIMHRIAWELRPASIDELGLASALANYVSEWSMQCNIAADFHCGDSRIDELSQEICTTIYRVVQEALTNVAKHARTATGVSIVIARTDGWLRLTIEDNGGGFDQNVLAESKTGPNGGLGLAGMRERPMLIGAEFEVESSLGMGTTIFARIPLEARRAAA